MADSSIMGVSVRVLVLGPFQVSVDGNRVDLPQGQLRILLAVLAMSPGRAVSVERLVTAVWGEDLPANGRRTIQTYVTRLRSILGSDAITTEPGGGYALRTPAENVDAERFGRLVDRAAREADVEQILLAEALGVWRGHPFDGVESDWLHEHERPRLQERRLTALERRIDLDLAAGQVEGLAAELRDLTAAYPLRESLWRRFLLALAQTGRQAEALEQYEKVRVRIAEELGVDPGAELQRVHADLLAGTVAPSTGRPAASRVEPRQLPVDLPRFTGRAPLLARLDEHLDRWQARPSVTLVAVDGPGGVGKTSLVVHWAYRIAKHFRDGQLYVNLRGYGPGDPMTPAAALDALLLGLGVPASQIPAEIDARVGLLRSELAEHRMLVILDNARDADQVRPLLPGSGESVVVVTSRSQLRGLVAREGAHRVSVAALDPADSIAFLAAAVGTDGASSDDAALTELADRCGHLPLALAIAAERADRQGDIGLDGLVAELREEQERLDALDIGEESASLRAVFATSYRALDAEVASMFRRLGLHLDSDISLPGAAALAGSTLSRVRRLLDRLVDGNLLQQRRPGRYELHDLLRSYAAELAEGDPEDERRAAVDRLLDWYLHSAMSAWEVMWPNQPSPDVGRPQEAVSPLAFSSREQALGWLESKRSALTVAVRVAAQRGQHATTFNLSRVLWMYLYRRRTMDDLLEVLRTTADSARRSDDRSGLAGTTLRLGIVFMHRADYEEARAHYERARELYELGGEDVGQGRALSNLGNLSTEMGRNEEAADFCERAIEWLVEAPREHGQGLNNLAVAYLRLGRHQDAYETALRAIDVSRDSSLEVEEASALDTLGQALLALGHAEEAVEHLRRARRLLVEVGARWEEGAILANLGRALSMSGDDEGARAAATQAMEIIDELGAKDNSEFNRADLRSLLAGLALPERGRSNAET